MAVLLDWARARLPTRDSLAANRFLAPFAHRLAHPSLWRFNRRSVPRGVALGLVAGLAVPFAHTLIAAALAIPIRANIVIAAGTTWVSNPLTWFVIFPAEHAIGRFLIHFVRAAPSSVIAAPTGTPAHAWLLWLLRATGDVAVGSLVLAAFAGALGYAIMALLWRLRVARKWRRRGRG